MLVKFINTFFISMIIPVIALGGELTIPLKDDKMKVEGLFKIVLEGVLNLAIPVIVLAIIYVGFLFIKAQGNDGELTKAKEALTWVLIGTAVIIAANALYHIFFAALK